MTVTDDQTAADHLAATRAIVPGLRDRAARAVTDRRVPVENMAALVAAGSLRTVQASRNGGLQLGMRDHLDVVSTLATGCGSTAWVAGVVQAHSWLLSHFPAEAQDEIYGADPDAVVSAVIGPRGRAVRRGDGYVLSGVWPFASGCERSSWLLLGGHLLDDAGNPVDEGDFAVPTDQVTIHDDWHVVGLAGTGSCTVAVAELVVPAHRFLSLPATVTGHSPGADLHDGWTAAMAPVPVLALALTGSAIGIARRALDDIIPLIDGKPIAYTGAIRSEHAVTHCDLADAVTRVDEGAALLYGVADGIDAAARAGAAPDLRTRARMRLHCAEGVRRCLEAVEILFQLGGASGIRAASPVARAVADLRAVNQHGLLDLRTNRELYGRVHLGLDPGSPLV